MDPELVQRTRYILRTRFRRAQTCPTAMLGSVCTQLLTWLNTHPVTAAHISGLKQLSSMGAPAAVYKVEADILERKKNAPLNHYGSYDPGFYNATDIEEHTALCLAILEVVARSFDKFEDFEGEFFLCLLGEYLTKKVVKDRQQEALSNAVGVIRDVAFDGLFEYLDERLDSRNVILALLLKYKQRSEWFRRERLRQYAQNELEGRKGEPALAIDLHEYLLDQSVEFFIEETSAKGEPDIVLREPDGKYIVVEAKYLMKKDNPSEIKRKLAKGFHQIFQYCNDFNEPAGYLVVFSESPLRLLIELEEQDSWRLLRLGGRQIYYVEISIADTPSASQLGRADEVTISKSDLVTDYKDDP
jgi:hypothetical protein